MADEIEMREGMSWEDYDILAFRHIKKEWLALELGLMTSKWFDYRFLHPVQATLVYANAFQKAYRDAFSRVIDRAAGEHIQIVNEAEFFEKNKPVKVSGLWRGRQIADAIGMPYEIYTALAMKHALNYWKQRHLPQAQQLYSERIVERVVDEWAERQKAILLFSTLPIYRNERYLGTRPQNDHHEWLFAQAELRPHRNELVARFAFQEAILPIEKVESRYEAGVLDEIRAFA
jgi:hypothetical protein